MRPQGETGPSGPTRPRPTGPDPPAECKWDLGSEPIRRALQVDAEACEGAVLEGRIEVFRAVGDQVYALGSGEGYGVFEERPADALATVLSVHGYLGQVGLDVPIALQVGETNHVLTIERDHTRHAGRGEDRVSARRIGRETRPVLSLAEREDAGEMSLLILRDRHGTRGWSRDAGLTAG